MFSNILLLTGFFFLMFMGAVLAFAVSNIIGLAFVGAALVILGLIV